MKKFFYRVKKEETLFSVAEKFGVPQTFLSGINEIKEEIEEGDVLYVEIPNGDRVRLYPEDVAAFNARADADEILRKNYAPYFYCGQDIIL